MLRFIILKFNHPNLIKKFFEILQANTFKINIITFIISYIYIYNRRRKKLDRKYNFYMFFNLKDKHFYKS